MNLVVSQNVSCKTLQLLHKKLPIGNLHAKSCNFFPIKQIFFLLYMFKYNMTAATKYVQLHAIRVADTDLLCRIRKFFTGSGFGSYPGYAKFYEQV